MRTSLLLIFILIFFADLSAQDSTTVTIKTGQKVTDVLTSVDIYYYPQFITGKVLFRDGSKAGAKLNYNLLYDQMLFIDTKGDTLALADEKTIKYIAVGKDTFCYHEGYLRMISNGDVVLAEKQTWVVADVRKIGTHNKSTTTFAVESFSTYTNGSDAAKSKDLILNEDIVLKRKAEYYFGDKFYNFVRAGKKGLLQLSPKNEQGIEIYLKDNKVNFDKKDDMEKLLQFLAQQ
jgi:hypothetical protein